MDRKQEGRELLDKVVTFLNERDEDSRKMWNLLSALRGPDSENEDVKHLTTSRLRGALGLRECSQFMVNNNPPIYAGEDNFDTKWEIDRQVKEILQGYQRENYHFIKHAASGNVALAYFGFIKPKE